VYYSSQVDRVPTLTDKNSATFPLENSGKQIQDFPGYWNFSMLSINGVQPHRATHKQHNDGLLQKWFTTINIIKRSDTTCSAFTTGIEYESYRSREDDTISTLSISTLSKFDLNVSSTFKFITYGCRPESVSTGYGCGQGCMPVLCLTAPLQPRYITATPLPLTSFDILRNKSSRNTYNK